MSSQIPGYQLVRKIGEGGMSTVYLAIQLSVGREVALKVLSQELRSDPSFAARLHKEANIVGRFSHPNIISIYDVNRHNQHDYMAMDYLPGGDCSALIKENTLTPLRSLAILRDISHALEYIHKQGFVHCDIKPDNIMFRANGSAVLTDFGIARELDNTKTTTISGTPHYMSPEQAQGNRLDKTADIYSLGILLFEMLTGSVPYQGKDAIAVAMKHVSAPLPLLPESLQVFQPLLHRMLAKRPGARFQNCHELIHALDFFETQYLRGNQQPVIPSKLQLQLYVDKAKHGLQQSIGALRNLRFSFKHGLIQKLVTTDFTLPDVARITQTFEASQANQNTTTNIALFSDPIAVALETQQARFLAPSWLIISLFASIVISLLWLIGSDATFSYINSLGNPRIIFVD